MKTALSAVDGAPRRPGLAYLDLALGAALTLCLPTTGHAKAKPTTLSSPATPDHWQGVRFGRSDFDSVRGLVRRQYIEPQVDTKHAWIGAANGALGRLDPAWEIAPESFLASRRNAPGEDRRSSGPIVPFSCGLQAPKGLVLHRIVIPEEPEATSSEDAQTAWHARARWQNARRRAEQDAWRGHAFAEAQFECAMKTARGWLPGAAGAAKWASVAGPPVTTGSDGKRRWQPAADESRLWIAATNGLLRTLDPHSAVLSRKAWDAVTSQTQDASFEGIGAILTHHGGRTLVENPMRGMPAWQAGLRAGDEVVDVDGQKVANMPLDAVVRLIRGPRDTVVVLGIRRADSPALLKFPIRRARVSMPNVTGELMPGHPGVAHVRMNGFVQLSTVDLRATIRSLAKAAPGGALTGLVLDLRGNGGGLLDQGLEVADMFLRHGRIVGIRGRRGMRLNVDDEVHEARRQPGWDLDLPLVLLVDDSSASASEIVAAALQDNGRALITGLRTFGKGSVQRLVEAGSDYYVKLTMWRYQAPSGRTIQVNGVRPDVQIGPKPDGTIPPGLREGDLAGHLPAIAETKAPPLTPIVGALLECERRSGQAGKLLASAANGPIRPDYQLLRSADLVRCLARLQAGR